ncbi:hypothetical protein ACTMTJ_38320 [Phytohabitans sp. LJ34]|uniref:hypothetical protein n=1 Tax=Phytohabitans sp. LJ34 TaxID=3452217 RepID=UPI003F8AE24C
MVAATVAAESFLAPQQASGRLITVVVAAGVCAAVVSRVQTAAAVTGLGYLLFVGFLVDGTGELLGQGLLGQGQLLAFAFAALVGVGYRRLRAVQADAALDAELYDLLDNAEKTGDDDQRPPG